MNLDLKKLCKKRSLFDYLMYSLIIVGGIIIDQLTKLIATKCLAPENPDSFAKIVPVIKFGDTNIFSFTYVRNPGAAWGMLENAQWVFLVISTVAIIVMSAYLFLGHTGSRLEAIGISMLISGGIGNMIDRLALKYVVDFLYFELIDFPVFNGADSFVCVGAGILILALLLQLVEETKNTKSGKKETKK